MTEVYEHLDVIEWTAAGGSAGIVLAEPDRERRVLLAAMSAQQLRAVASAALDAARRIEEGQGLVGEASYSVILA